MDYRSESIYNLVPNEYIPPKKEPMFKSKFVKDPYYPGSTFGCTGTTRPIGAGKMTRKPYGQFGPRDGEPSIRTLQLSAKESLSASGSHFTYNDSLKPKIPSKDDKPVMGIRSSKNFITANAVEAILQVPRAVETQELNYMTKEDFGKVPKYLTYVKEEIKRENEMIQKYVKEQLGEVDEEPIKYEEYPETERRDLIYALKLKWDKVNAEYQKITHLVHLDTTGQRRRKERLEEELRTLENDIEKLQKQGPLLIF